MHLYWLNVPDRPVAVRATLEVLEPPRVDALYFFALQASFRDGRRSLGGGHTGLQWNRRHRGSTAINWGGYQDQALGGSVLAGTTSRLPSRPNDPNTRDYGWRSGTPYRLTIEPGSEPGAWNASVEDLSTAQLDNIREIYGGGDRLASPMVWAEVFAACDAPSISIQWSRLEAYDPRRGWSQIKAVRVNYQSFSAGGCTNTDSASWEGGFLQRTNVTRSNPQGTVLHGA